VGAAITTAVQEAVSRKEGTGVADVTRSFTVSQMGTQNTIPRNTQVNVEQNV